MYMETAVSAYLPELFAPSSVRARSPSGWGKLAGCAVASKYVSWKIGDQAGLVAVLQFGVCLHENPGRRPKNRATSQLLRHL